MVGDYEEKAEFALLRLFDEKHCDRNCNDCGYEIWDECESEFACSIKKMISIIERNK